MRAAIAVALVEKRAFDVQTGDYTASHRILLAEGRERRQPPAHGVETIGDDRRERGADAVGLEAGAGEMQPLCGQSILIEIDAGISVDLEINVIVRRAHPIRQSLI